MQISLSTDRFANKSQLEQCHSYIRTQLEIRKKHAAVPGSPPPGPAITISHQTGSGAHDVAARLAGLLQLGEPKGTAPWTVFDRDLVDRMLEEHHLPQSLAEFMSEDRRSFIQDVMRDLLGVIPPSWVVAQQIAETVLHLVDAGHVILVGRGANFITARMPNVFHVRLIASLPQRIERVQELNHLSLEEAAKFVKKVDRARGRYMKAHFHVGINDDLLYHLVINTDRIPCPDAAQLIVDGARMCFQSRAGGKK